jgi:hypothetical protein
MGYKLLGFVVWQGGKWYGRRRRQATQRKVAVAALAALLMAGVAATQRRPQSR